MEGIDKDNQTISKNEDARILQRQRIIILILLALLITMACTLQQLGFFAEESYRATND
ncbi:hypothetical protein ACFLV7_10680 [Chloroflexota bacterium]